MEQSGQRLQAHDAATGSRVVAPTASRIVPTTASGSETLIACDAPAISRMPRYRGQQIPTPWSWAFEDTVV